MGVLKFDDTDDQLKWTTLASALSNVSAGAWTAAVLIKNEAHASFSGYSYLHTGAGAGTAVAGLSMSSSTNGPTVDVGSGFVFGDGADLTDGQTYLLVMSKPAGAGSLRIGIKAGSAGSWNHFDTTSGTMADQAAAAQLQIGTWQDTDFMDGWIGVVGWWEGAMSDGNKQSLGTNWRTSDMWTSAHGSPAFLAELNVAAGSVVDLAGNATSLSVGGGGPTLDAGETLDNWNFDSTGVVVPTPTYGSHPRRGVASVA